MAEIRNRELFAGCEGSEKHAVSIHCVHFLGGKRGILCLQLLFIPLICLFVYFVNYKWVAIQSNIFGDNLNKSILLIHNQGHGGGNSIKGKETFLKQP